jgi:hypothetical protein
VTVLQHRLDRVVRIGGHGGFLSCVVFDRLMSRSRTRH